MTRQDYQLQASLYQAVRSWFSNQGFAEIQIPVFHRALPVEPTLYSFSTEWETSAGSERLYMTISPESRLKKAMAAGVGSCFGIGSCFRNLEGSGSLHSPEFTMLEWYRVDAEYPQIMADTRELITAVKMNLDEVQGKPFTPEFQYRGHSISLDVPWPSLSLEILFAKLAGIRLSEITSDQVLIEVVKAKGYSAEKATWEQLFNQMFLNEIEPHLPSTPFFLVDFPARLSPLCAVNTDKPYLAQRFELYIAGIEVANGNTERVDAAAVLRDFQAEDRQRERLGESRHPIDMELIEALEVLQKSGQTYAGIGLGLDRLLMMLTNRESIEGLYLQ